MEYPYEIRQDWLPTEDELVDGVPWWYNQYCTCAYCINYRRWTLQQYKQVAVLISIPFSEVNSWRMNNVSEGGVTPLSGDGSPSQRPDYKREEPTDGR